jgi:hypothetical protein
MTYVKRRSFRKRPKDILTMALKNLWPGEELLCTKRTHEAIRGRVEVFCQSRKDKRIATIQATDVVKIRRVG